MANKPIHELFPERTRRVRRGRGFLADVEIKSTPSTRDFFEALASKLVYYEETLVEKDMRFCGEQSTYVDAFYDDVEHHRYGFIHYGICNCANCNGLGLDQCLTGRDLSARVSGVQRYIHWYHGQELFLVNLCRYTTDMKIITPIITYFYPYEEDRNPALLLQVRLIEQQKEIARERAAARARYVPPPVTFYDDLTTATFIPPPGVTVAEVRTGQVVEPVVIPAQQPVATGAATFAERLREILGRPDNLENFNVTLARARATIQEAEDANVFAVLDRAAETPLGRTVDNLEARVDDLEARVTELQTMADLEQIRRENR